MRTPNLASFPPVAALRFDPSQTTQLGCSVCATRGLCGGLDVAGPIFDCHDLCACAYGGRCGGLCPRNARDFVAHIREVHGLALDNVPRVAPLAFEAGSLYAPIVYDRFRRDEPLSAPVVAVPLMRLFSHASGAARYLSPITMRSDFLIAPGSTIIASGVDDDPAIEAWWRARDRPRLIAQLRALGISFVTTPNYSLYMDVTRWDNLHNMKRIALAWAEFMAGGIPCALHLNARTTTDYRRWRDFVGERPEVTAVAFEFLTGAKGLRGDYHREELIALAQEVGRPLTLVLRGGTRHIGRLAAAFASIWLLDATPQMKAKNRRRGVVSVPGRLRWESAPTSAGAPVDALFAQNVAVCRASQAARLGLPGADNVH